MAIYGSSENYLRVSYDEFYIPTEVNGIKPSALDQEPMDAHRALYEYEPGEFQNEADQFGIVVSSRDANAG